MVEALAIDFSDKKNHKALNDGMNHVLELVREKLEAYTEEQQLAVMEGLIKTIPIDPYTDKPLVYKVTEDNFILYSIGRNFTDDGGEYTEFESWRETQQDGDYIFWPVFPEEKIDTLLTMFRHLLEFIISGQLIHHKDYDLVQPVIEHIQAHPQTPLSLTEAARMSSRSPSTVSRLFKKITGRSFKQYQIWFRLNRASQMLESMPNRPVAEIAQDCGFDDPLYFSRTFRKHFGYSPTIHRSQKISG